MFHLNICLHWALEMMGMPTSLSTLEIWPSSFFPHPMVRLNLPSNKEESEQKESACPSPPMDMPPRQDGQDGPTGQLVCHGLWLSCGH